MALMFALVGGACKDRETPVRERPARGDPPPPAPAKPAASACSGASHPNDPANLVELPATAGPFCLDPAGSDHGYGDGAKGALEGICDLFDGECAVYQKLGVKRVVEARYVDGGGSSATINVILSRFASPEQALAMFTKRALGGGDPAHPDTPKPLAAGGLAALGIGNAYLWRGAELAEITYNDGDASAEQIAAKGSALLPPLAKELAAKMPGATDLPAAVKLLPEAARLPLGLSYEPTDALVPGAGAGAFGYYQEGDKRWRVLAMAERDEAQAKDVLKTIAAGGVEEKGIGDAAVRVLAGARKTEWIVGRKGARIVGVGDETLVLRPDQSADDHAKVCLTQDDKRKRVRELLEKN